MQTTVVVHECMARVLRLLAKKSIITSAKHAQLVQSPFCEWGDFLV